MGVLALLHSVLCSAALAISGYALYVDLAKESDENFEALCDITPQMSCSAVLTSKYSRGLGIIGDLLGEDHPLNLKNCVCGIVYYCFIALLGCYKSSFTLLIVISSELLCLPCIVYLEYTMFYLLNETCLVCLSLHVVHILLLTLHLYQWCQKKQQKKKTH